jgi:ubiquinone/menaquinone biosynthesis C-methylase UbiE
MAAIEQYQRAAPGYDRHMKRFARWQRLAVERLALQPGDAVIDVACGTGLNFGLLQERIGSGGRLIGIELSPEMLAQARERVAVHGWENVTLIETAVEEARFEARADAALFSFTHDVLQSAAAVANVVAHLKPGARVASVGAKLARRGPVVNFFVRRSARPYMTTLRGLDRPWGILERYITELELRPLALGGAYVCSARIRDEAPNDAARASTKSKPMPRRR